MAYKTWYSDGSVEVVTDEEVTWASPYQFLFGEVFFDVTDLDGLRKVLESVCFREEYRPPKAKIGCGEKSAILMKYLEEKGFRVSMGRRTLSLDEEEEVPHAWVLVHLEGGTYVVEVNTESGFADIVGTVKDAAESLTLKYKEKERWDVKKVKEKYSDFFKEPINKYLEEKKK